jgi:predicted RNA-binding protein with PIN domain
VAAEHAATGGREAEQVLVDLPPSLLAVLLRAVRRAVDRLDRAALPVALRPYLGWKPERLAGDRPLAAVAQALVADPRLRESVAEALDADAVAAAAEGLDALRLAASVGAEAAVAALAVSARWSDIAVLAASAGPKRDERDVAAEDGRRATGEQPSARRAAAALAAARDERDAQRRRADAAEQRERRERAQREHLEALVTQLRGELAHANDQLVEQQRQTRERLARLRRRADEAAARARAATTRVADVLETLASELRTTDAQPTGERDPTGRDSATPLPVPPLPRGVAAAEPGRPCRLPLGLVPDHPQAVTAVLQVPGIEVLLDGYNVSKDPMGQPGAALEDQRRWLVRVAAAVVARYRNGVTVVFDGTDAVAAPVPAARGVRVVFTVGEETADERIVAIAAGMDPAVPLLVVSSDREVRDACGALAANVAASSAFLAAVGA